MTNSSRNTAHTLFNDAEDAHDPLKTLISRLSAVDRAHVSAPDRTAKDVRSAVQACLVALEDAIGQAGCGLLPWPLRLLAMELQEVNDGRESVLFAVDTVSSKKRDRATGRHAHRVLRNVQKAYAVGGIEILSTVMTVEDAKSKVADALQAGGYELSRGAHNEATHTTLTEWAKPRHAKENTTFATQLKEARQTLERLIPGGLAVLTNEERDRAVNAFLKSLTGIVTNQAIG